MAITIPASAVTKIKHPRSGFLEGGHQLEKLEFALAVAMSRGDDDRSAQLREQIEALGGNVEEPGT